MKKYWAICCALFAADRASKAWAQNVLSALPGGRMGAIKGLFRFQYARNTGAAFSVLSGQALLTAGVAALVAATAAAYFCTAKILPRYARAGLLFVAFGGAGNLLDRLLYGYVIDFIDLVFMRFAVFNVADMMITCGAVLAAAGILRSGKGDAR